MASRLILLLWLLYWGKFIAPLITSCVTSSLHPFQISLATNRASYVHLFLWRLQTYMLFSTVVAVPLTSTESMSLKKMQQSSCASSSDT